MEATRLASDGSASTRQRVAWVTGSSTGLGKAIAFALAQTGAKVAFNFHRNAERGEQTFAEFRAAGGNGMLVRGDVTSAEGVGAMYAQIKRELGPVDILVPNATPDQPQRPIEEYAWEDYQVMIDFFLKSPYLLARACLPHMKSQRWGRIVNIGSEAFQRGAGNFSAYVAAKGAQYGWTRSMASELAPTGITVNIVAPGWIPVERHAKDSAKTKDAYLKSIPVGRWGTPQDVAASVAYLAGEDAGFVTGQSISINGGMTFN